MQEAAGPVLGVSRRLPRGHAAVRALDPRREGGMSCSGCRAGASGFSCGARARESLGPRAPQPPLPRGECRLRGGQAAPGDAPTCCSAAGIRAEAARPPCLRPSPRQPPPPAQRHVGEAQPITGRGRRGASWEEKWDPWEVARRTFPAAEVELAVAVRCPLGVAPCGAPSPALPSTTSPSVFSTNVAPVAVPGSADEPEAASAPDLKGLVSQGKQTPHEKVTVSVVSAGKICLKAPGARIPPHCSSFQGF